MIVLDTSALVAVLLGEPQIDAIYGVLWRDDQRVISAVTLAELLVVAASRRISREASELLSALGPTVYDATEERAREIASVYRRWGKGFHPAKLNYCDCFAYALAVELNCPLLYIGSDFAQTDVTSALA